MKCFVSFFRVSVFFVYLFLVYFAVFNRILLLLLLFFYPRSFLAFWTIILYLYLYVICVAIQSNIHKHLLLFYSSSWYFFISYIFCLNLFVYFFYTYFVLCLYSCCAIMPCCFQMEKRNVFKVWVEMFSFVYSSLFVIINIFLFCQWKHCAHGCYVYLFNALSIQVPCRTSSCAIQLSVFHMKKREFKT